MLLLFFIEILTTTFISRLITKSSGVDIFYLQWVDFVDNCRKTFAYYIFIWYDYIVLACE